MPQTLVTPCANSAAFWRGAMGCAEGGGLSDSATLILQKWTKGAVVLCSAGVIERCECFT